MFGIKVLNHLHLLFLLLFARIDIALKRKNKNPPKGKYLHMEASIQTKHIWHGMAWYAMNASNTFLHAYACVLAKLFQQCDE